MVFKNICILVLWTKVASALEGLIQSDIEHFQHLHTFFKVSSEQELVKEAKRRHAKAFSHKRKESV